MTRKTGAESGHIFPHVWRWKNRLPGRFGQRCRILLQRSDRVLWIEFEDGFRTYCSPFAVCRWTAKWRAKHESPVEQLTLEGM